jgi:hypothetical protein
VSSKKESTVDRAATKNDVDNALERLALRMAIRVGVMLVAFVGILLVVLPPVLK